MTMIGKRQRPEIPSWWEALTAEIVSNGGFIHPGLRFLHDENRELVLNTPVNKKGILIMRIPRTTFITHERALNLMPWWNEVVEKSSVVGDFHSPLHDIVLAVALASSSSDNIGYLSTLPDPASFDSLPRRWSDSDVKRRLQGSPLLERVQVEKKGVQNDFQILKIIFSREKKHNLNDVLPSFSRYNDMLAAVSSRAFDIGGDGGGQVALVPILDLCDHCRGDGEKKNLSYAFEGDSMVVRSVAQKILAGERLRLTYGAQGNPQLLLNYGFCISNNIEPDGSSNDVLEFRLEDDRRSIVHLRTGPKSYTYGCLVKAIDLCHEFHQDKDGSNNHGKSDMDTYLNEGEGDGEDEDIDIYGDMDGTNADPDEQSGGEGEESDLMAFAKLHAAIIEKLAGYSRHPQTPSKPSECSDYNAALLIQSEQRTLTFFGRAVDEISMIMRNRAANSSVPAVNNQEQENNLAESQIEALVQAFIQIRCGEF